MKKRAKVKTTKRVKRKDPSRYVAFSDAVKNTVFGVDDIGIGAKTMTLAGAKRKAASFGNRDVMRGVYKLVPVFVLQPGQVVGKKKGRKK